MEPHSAAPIEQVPNEKSFPREQHLEMFDPAKGDLVYDDADHEPELHFKTYFALGAMFLLNFVGTFAIFSPPVAVSHSDAQWNSQAN